jgi:hypothetical protein
MRVPIFLFRASNQFTHGHTIMMCPIEIGLHGVVSLSPVDISMRLEAVSDSKFGVDASVV